MPRASWTDADLARARVMVETTGWSFLRISRETGIPKTTIGRRAVAEGWTRPEGAEPETRTPPSLIKARQAKAAGPRREVGQRIRALLNRYLREAEARARGKADLGAREREMRLIVGVTRIYREIEALDSASAAGASGEQERPTDDAIPAPSARNHDELCLAFADLVLHRFQGGDPPRDS